MRVAAIGLDIAKSVFQAHDIDRPGELLRKRLACGKLPAFFANLPLGVIDPEAPRGTRGRLL